MNIRRCFTLAILATLLTACSPSTPENDGQEAVRLEVRLMETTDIHAYLLGYDYFRQRDTNEYGLSYTAALIEAAKQENPNHILVDNGDLIQGSALGDWAASQGAEFLASEAHPVIAALNHLNYDVGNLGNHEFNFGLEFLQATLADAAFPYISANVYYAQSEQQSGKLAEGWGQPLVEPYVILPRNFVDNQGTEHAIHIGVIGFLPPQIMRWDDAHLRGKLAVRDMVDAAEHYVPIMREQGADIVVAIPHSGLSVYESYPEFAEQATYQLAGVEGIDALLFGHHHRVFPGDPDYAAMPSVDSEQGLVRGVPAVSPGYWGSHLGIIDLTLEQRHGQWHVLGSQSEARPITEQQDDSVASLVASEHQATLDMINQPLAEIETPITSYFARALPTPTETLINQAQRWYGHKLQEQSLLNAELPVLSAAAPFRSGHQSSNDYTVIGAGTVTLANFMDLYIYPNTLHVVEVTGAQLKEWLEMSAVAFNQIEDVEEEQSLFSSLPSFNFDVISGLTYQIDVTEPARYSQEGQLVKPDVHRIKELKFQQRPVDKDQRFLVVTNNYRAGGGGNFPGLDGSATVFASQDEVRQIITEYAQHQAHHFDGMLPVSTENNWSLKLPDTAQAVFQSSNAATAQGMAESLPVEWVREQENGYALYRVATSPD